MTTGAVEGGAGAGAEPARVLVVDDEESITQLVSTVLRYEGFAVETAPDGRAAVRAAKTDTMVTRQRTTRMVSTSGVWMCRRVCD